MEWSRQYSRPIGWVQCPADHYGDQASGRGCWVVGSEELGRSTMHLAEPAKIHIVQAEQSLAAAAMRIERQKALVQQLAVHNKDTADAERLLALLIESRQLLYLTRMHCLDEIEG